MPGMRWRREKSFRIAERTSPGQQCVPTFPIALKILNFIKQHTRTFLKYSVVGASGTVIDVVGFTGLIALTDMPRNLAASLSFSAAVVNNYTWNRIWTFRSRAPGIGKQFTRFLAISLSGLVLNLVFLGIFSALAVSLTIYPSVEQLPPQLNAAAKLSASAVVAIYNFLANRFITFHPRHEATK